MKKILQILVILLLINCGTRKTATEKIKENTTFSTGQNLSKKEEVESKSETSIDFSKVLDNLNIAVIADGNPFTINYKGFIYSGTAPVEISNKKEQIKTKFVQKIATIYKSKINYQTKTTYKSQIIFKEKKSESKRPMFWTYILSGVLSIVLFLFLTNKFKI